MCLHVYPCVCVCAHVCVCGITSEGKLPVPRISGLIKKAVLPPNSRNKALGTHGFQMRQSELNSCEGEESEKDSQAQMQQS